MRTRIIGCGVAIGLLGLIGCGGDRASFSKGEGVSEGTSSSEDASNPDSPETETDASTFAGESQATADASESSATTETEANSEETDHSDTSADESFATEETERSETVASDLVTDELADGGMTGSAPMCDVGESEDCGDCGERVCDPEALTWGPCGGDGRVEGCWEGEDGSALPAAAAGAGSCALGERVCGAEGEWSACLGAIVEGCECTADTEGSCADALPCTEDACADGTCHNSIKDGFCLIEGQCVGAGQAQVDSICSVCNPALNQMSWSAAENGTQNPSNPCQICSGVSLVANVGVACGSEPNECSAQDTCDADAVCQANDEDDGDVCSEGECHSGECEPLPFDCVAPTPPTVEHDANIVFIFENDLPPAPEGGTVRDGKYVPFRIDVFGAPAEPSYDLRTFEVRGPYVQIGQRPWIGTFFAIGEIQFAGGFAAVNNTLVWDLQRCDPQLDIDVDDLEYTATVNGLSTFDRLEDGVTVVVNYARSE